LVHGDIAAVTVQYLVVVGTLTVHADLAEHVLGIIGVLFSSSGGGRERHEILGIFIPRPLSFVEAYDSVAKPAQQTLFEALQRKKLAILSHKAILLENLCPDERQRRA
jgi:hypothetical protein